MSLHGNDFENEFGAGSGGGLFGNALSKQAAGPFAGNGPEDVGLFGEGGLFGAGGTASIALGGLKTLGSIWSSYQQNKMAKKSFKLQKRAFETNLSNSVQAYNTALEDRIYARYAAEGRLDQVDAKVAENRLNT